MIHEPADDGPDAVSPPGAGGGSPRKRGLLSRNIFSNWVVMGANLVYSLAITPIVIRALQQELYGVWSFLNGLLAYTDLMYFGVGLALVRGVATHAHQRDQAAVNRLLSVVLSIYATVGLVCFLVFGATSRLVPEIFPQPLSADAARTASTAWVLLGLQVSLAFVRSGFSGHLLGHDRFDLLNLVRLTTIVIRFMAIPFAVRGPDPLTRLAFVTMAAAGLELVSCILLAYWIDPAVRVRPVRPTRRELADLYGFGIQAFFITTAIKLISYTDVVVVGSILGAGAVALYSLPLQLIDYAKLFIVGMVGVLVPRLTVQHNVGDLESLRGSYRIAAQTCTLIIATLNVHLMFVGAPFLTLWVGPTYGAEAVPILVCLGTAMILQVFSTQVTIPFFHAMGLLRAPAVCLLAEGALNLALSVTLARFFGMTGVALGTLLATLGTSFVFLPRYLCRHLSMSPGRLLADTMIPVVILAGALVLYYLIVDQYVPSSSYLLIAAKTLPTLPVTAAALLVLLRKGEKAGHLAALAG